MGVLSLMENKTAALQGLWGSIQLLMQNKADKNNEDTNSLKSMLLLKRNRHSFVYCSGVLGRFLRGFIPGNSSGGVSREAFSNLCSRDGRCCGNLGLVSSWVGLSLLPHMIVMLFGLKVSCKSTCRELETF